METLSFDRVYGKKKQIIKMKKMVISRQIVPLVIEISEVLKSWSLSLQSINIEVSWFLQVHERPDNKVNLNERL